jgi:hypothetical protein
MNEYRHTQRGRLGLLMVVLAVVETVQVSAILVAVGIVKEGAATVAVCVVIMAVVAALLIGCGKIFSSMTVQVRDGRLEWWFGRGFPRYSRFLSEIEEARVWTPRGFALGIHSTRDGRLYNVWGMKGVRVVMRSGKAFILGTDEPEALEAALDAALYEYAEKEAKV